MDENTKVTLGELGDAYVSGFREGVYYGTIRTAIVTSIFWVIFVILAGIAISLLHS